MDLNPPILMLTAMHVINDTDDPYFTYLQAGAYAQHKPSGVPCDAAFNCFPPHLSEGGTIALAVIVTLSGLAISVLACWYFILLFWSKKL
jgi:endoglucanase